MTDRDQTDNIATAGLPETTPGVDQALRDTGIDPDRLSVFKLGVIYRFSKTPYWVFRLLLGLGMWGSRFFIQHHFPQTPAFIIATLTLITGLIILDLVLQTGRCSKESVPG